MSQVFIAEVFLVLHPSAQQDEQRFELFFIHVAAGILIEQRIERPAKHGGTELQGVIAQDRIDQQSELLEGHRQQF